MADIGIGTSAFTAEGWEGSFHPEGVKPADCLSYYSTKFDTVELGNTFYRTPALASVQGWNAKTLPSFIFTVKVANWCRLLPERIMFKFRPLQLALLLLAWTSLESAQFAHTNHKQIVDAADKPLLIS
jgi:hypothetical protein